MYEVYGLKLGDRDVDSSMILAHTDQGKLVRISYYMWCIRSTDTVVLVDTGMTDEEIKKKNFVDFATPVSLLRKINVNPKEVRTVVVTHLHYDHFSAYGLYPNATFYIQKKEVEFFATVNVENKDLIFAVSDIAEVVRLNYSGRVKFVSGDEQIAPGLSLFCVGAHSPGSQVVAVETSRGIVVLCADVADLYRSIEDNIPGGRTFNLVQSYAALEKVKKLASSPDLIVPGHDPLIMDRFSRVADGVVRIG